VSTPIVITLHQVHARFVDETMRGSYQYAPLKLILTKVEQEGTAPQKTEQHQLFLEGEYIQYQHAHIELPNGLDAGEFVLFLRAEWSPLNPVRRLVTQIYAQDPVDLKRMNNKKYPLSIYAMMDEWLGQHMIDTKGKEIDVEGGIGGSEGREIPSIEYFTGFSVKVQCSIQKEKVFYRYIKEGKSQFEKEQSFDLLGQQKAYTARKKSTGLFDILEVDVIREALVNKA